MALMRQLHAKRQLKDSRELLWGLAGVLQMPCLEATTDCEVSLCSLGRHGQAASMQLPACKQDAEKDATEALPKAIALASQLPSLSA
jgi:hypothetical protein